MNEKMWLDGSFLWNYMIYKSKPDFLIAMIVKDLHVSVIYIKFHFLKKGIWL